VLVSRSLIIHCSEPRPIRRGDGFADRASLGLLRRAFLTWISEFRTRCLSMPVPHVRPKLALNAETSKKE
jgi:hypothetical protein